jgi:hypothetical protein
MGKQVVLNRMDPLGAAKIMGALYFVLGKK